MADVVPWESKADQGWARAVAALPSKVDGATVVLSGPCPHCHEPMSAPVTVGPVARMGPVAEMVAFEVAEPALGAPPAKYVVWCNCTGDHKGRPADQAGCGRYGLLEVTF
jgi:hypothetical protein